MVEYSCSTCVNTTGFTNESVSILGKSLSSCRICYRDQPGNMISNEKTKKCNFSAMGCAMCEETICDVWWDTGTNIAITVQHIYYYIKYQLYDHLTDFLPVVQSNVISWSKQESRRCYEFLISFQYVCDKSYVLLIRQILHRGWILYHFMCIDYQLCVPYQSLNTANAYLHSQKPKTPSRKIIQYIYIKILTNMLPWNGVYLLAPCDFI